MLVLRKQANYTDGHGEKQVSSIEENKIFILKKLNKRSKKHLDTQTWWPSRLNKHEADTRLTHHDYRLTQNSMAAGK